MDSTAILSKVNVPDFKKKKIVLVFSFSRRLKVEALVIIVSISKTVLTMWMEYMNIIQNHISC